MKKTAKGVVGLCATAPLLMAVPILAIGAGTAAASCSTGGAQDVDTAAVATQVKAILDGGDKGSVSVPGLDDPAEQVPNAKTIQATGVAMNIPARGQVVALATALQESGLRNLTYGDRDSLGLFQQRPSQGWGSPSEVTDPVHATTIFIQRLMAIPGWEALPVTVAAQTVQRSAFPNAYAKWEGLASGLVQQLANVASPAASCGPVVLAQGVAAAAIAFALHEVGKPYVWGAVGPNSYDCSGLMQTAFEAAGVTLPRVSWQQYNAGGHVPVRQAQPGDLLFYATDPSDPSTIHHVMLYMGNDQMVEAPYSGKPVRVQPVPWDYRELVPLATRPGTTPNRA